MNHGSLRIDLGHDPAGKIDRAGALVHHPRHGALRHREHPGELTMRDPLVLQAQGQGRFRQLSRSIHGRNHAALDMTTQHMPNYA